MNFLPIKIPERLVLTDIYTFFVRHCAKDFAFPGEVHNFWECVLVIKGGICASGDGKVYNLSRGDMICHKPMELHKFYSDSPVGAELLIFSFSAKGPITDELKNKVFSLSEQEMKIAEGLTHYAKASGFSRTNGDMTDFLSEPDDIYTETLASHIKLLLLHLAGSGQSAETSDSPEAEVFSLAVSFMNEHIAQSVSVSDIARSCNVSISALKRIFSKYSDCGVHKYFLKLKIKRAASLLSSGKTVTETAELLGFSDQGYFSKAYFRETGVSPSKAKGTHDGF